MHIFILNIIWFMVSL